MDFDSPTALRARVLALEETVLLLAGVMASYPQTRRDLEVRIRGTRRVRRSARRVGRREDSL